MKTQTNTVCSSPGCTATGTLQCPTCKKEKLPPANFCSQECFKTNWKSHKKAHNKKIKCDATNNNQEEINDCERKLKPHEFRVDAQKFQDITNYSITRELEIANYIKERSDWFRSIHYIRSNEDTTKLIPKLKDMEDDFTWSTSFSPSLVAGVCKEGFLPMAIPVQRYFAVFTPKLHKMRCILDFQDLHVPRSIRKRAKKFELTVDKCFDFCIQQCCKQHGEGCWFYPALIKAYRKIFYKPDQFKGIKMHSFELWSNGTVVAGEIGYAVGGVYTSVSGFRTIDSSGTIQCCCVAKVLEAKGFDFWDLGMSMDYKDRLGARSVPRKEFLKRFLKSRDKKNCYLQWETPNNAREVLQL